MTSTLTYNFTRLFCRTKIIQHAKLNFFLQQTLDSSFKGVVFNLKTQVLYTNYLNHQKFTYLFANEALLTNQLVFYFQKNHFLADKFSEKIIRFQESGLIEEIMSKYVDNRFVQEISQVPQQAVMTLKQLSAVFGVWISGLLLSTLAFAVENIKNFTKRKIMNTFE